ncbi:MAG TPA: DUF1540 domain-containing protein [Symbiobacteriaceae bacterium]|nr:DUF1540 domain-containing protein [Symbiobacteriaceae bacterium]
MAHQEILCTVDSCFYNDSARVCKAAKIMVQNNFVHLNDIKMEVGSMDRAASNSNETLCQTFISKEKGPKPGIERLP